MPKPSKDPDVFNEPHLQAQLSGTNPPTPHGADHVAHEPALSNKSRALDSIEHSVWDEPSVALDPSDPASQDALTYRRFLDGRIRATSEIDSWIVTLGLMLLAGPVAAIASILFLAGGGQQGLASVTVMCIISPLLQEMFKIMIPLWIAEKRPWLFKSWFQFFLIGLTTGTIFAVVNNWFLAWILPDTTAAFLFLWIGVLGLHLIMTTISMTGVERIWRQTLAQSEPPRVEIGYPFFITAIGIHIVFSIAYTVLLVIYEFRAWM